MIMLNSCLKLRFDKLGKEFELSRITKQRIFNKRKDLSMEQKSEIYFKMNKDNKVNNDL